MEIRAPLSIGRILSRKTPGIYPAAGQQVAIHDRQNPIWSGGHYKGDYQTALLRYAHAGPGNAGQPRS